MSKFIQYFYIFSKLTTSLVFFLIIIIMGYIMFRSYQGIDSEQNEIEVKISSLDNKINKNSSEILEISNRISIIKNSIKDVNEILSEKEDISIQLDNKKNILQLSNSIKELQIQIDESLKLNRQNNIENTLPGEKLDNSQQINSLINFIKLKYRGGEEIKSELVLLENILSNKKNEIFEKLYILEANKFFGVKILEELFNESTSAFVKNRFLDGNQNSVIKFFFKFITIRPTNLNYYENDDLNKLIKAKEKMLIDDIDESLNIIFAIDNNNFFNKWIEQAKIYAEFKNVIEKVNQ